MRDTSRDQKDVGSPAEIAKLRDLVREWDDATVKGEAAALDRLLADEFAFVGGVRRKAYLDSVKTKSADTFVESAVSQNVQVQIYGDTAVVTGVDVIKGKNGGQPYDNKYLYMDVWVKRAGRWQCVKVCSNPTSNN
jgi:ketosteroid isomerase-like protein